MLFNIATYLEKNTPEELDEDDNRVFDQDNEHEWDPEDITLSNHLHLAAFAQVNYFEMADVLTSGHFPNAPKPHWTFSTATSTFHFALKPSLWLSIDDAAAKFNLSNLPLALYEYRHCVEGPSPHTVLEARSYTEAHNLPFEHIQIWCKIHIQQMCYHDKTPDAPQTLQVIPPFTDNPYGLYDAVIVNTTSQSSWPKQGLDSRSLSNLYSLLLTHIGHSIVQLQMIFHPLHSDNMIAYVQCFDVIPQCGLPTHPKTSMHLLQHAVQPDGSHIGDIIPVTLIQSPAHLIPNFGDCAHNHLTSQSGYELLLEFWLNKYWSKEFYYSLSL